MTVSIKRCPECGSRDCRPVRQSDFDGQWSAACDACGTQIEPARSRLLLLSLAAVGIAVAIAAIRFTLASPTWWCSTWGDIETFGSAVHATAVLARAALAVMLGFSVAGWCMYQLVCMYQLGQRNQPR